MKVVPLHSVVIILRNEDKTFWDDVFPSHEFMSLDDIRTDLIGMRDHAWKARDIILDELVRRMINKLKLGERVVIFGGDLSKSERIRIINAAHRCGGPIFYASRGAVEDSEVARGDGIAEVINTQVHDIEAVLHFDAGKLSEKWKGITVVGDVHGMHQSLLCVIDWARQRNHFLLFVGDIIDYGGSTLEVGDEVYRLVMRGEAALVVGNHERKIMRWADGHRVRLSGGNRVTTSALAALGDSAKSRWIGRFRALYSLSRLYRTIGDVTFIHGAAHPALWNGDSAEREIENTAFFGEIDQALSKPDHPVRSYRWVDSIPESKTVVVGHDIRSTASPYVCPNEQGGKAIFLDTGSGKGGHLSTADFRFTENGLSLLNFNIH